MKNFSAPYRFSALFMLAIVLCGWPSINIGGGAGGCAFGGVIPYPVHAYSFDEFTTAGTTQVVADQGGSRLPQPAVCNTNSTAPQCGTHSATNGPRGTGAYKFDNLQPLPGFEIEDTLLQNFLPSNQFSVSAHIFRHFGSGGFAQTVLWKLSEYQLGPNNLLEGMCIDVLNVTDDGACGATALASPWTFAVWDHWVWVFDKTEYRIYRNGVLEATESGITGTISDEFANMRIGSAATQAAYWIDNLIVWNGAISQQAISILPSCDVPNVEREPSSLWDSLVWDLDVWG